MMKLRAFSIAIIVALSLAGVAHAKTIRASELTSEQWGEVLQSKSQTTIEFRQGDEIPVSFSAQGDFLETSTAGVSYVKVKKSFWLRLQNQTDLLASPDGITFRPLNDLASGSFEVGAGQPQPGVPVRALNMVLKALAK